MRRPEKGRKPMFYFSNLGILLFGWSCFPNVFPWLFFWYTCSFAQPPGEDQTSSETGRQGDSVESQALEAFNSCIL